MQEVPRQCIAYRQGRKGAEGERCHKEKTVSIFPIYFFLSLSQTGCWSRWDSFLSLSEFHIFLNFQGPWQYIYVNMTSVVVRMLTMFKNN